MSTAVAMASGSRSYTDASTHVTSASTRCGTQAPRATNASAAATCLASSRVTSRTRTFVSIARTPPLDIATQARLQIGKRAGLRRFGEQGSVNVLGRESARAPDDD